VPDRPEDLLTHAATAFLAVPEGELIGIGRLGADA
jgi:hypothetical protein